jgi:hypothetical protein
VLADQDNATELLTVLTPVPESAIVSGEFVALLATATLPVALPEADGVKVAVKVVVCPGVRISPVATPLAVKPAPEMVTPETVTLEFPALVNVTLWLLLLDKFTLPKLKEAELALSRSVAALTVSVAELLVALPALLVTVTVNLALVFEAVSAGVV